MELIGIGRQAEVYAVDENECVKLFYPEHPKREVEVEAERMRFVARHGVPSPRFIALEQINGRWAIRMERLHGITLLHDALEHFKPEFDYGGVLGAIQKEYHQICAEGLGDMVEALEWCIKQSDALTPAYRGEIIKRLRAMPRGDRLVHLDYHSDNVVLTPDGAKVIDWNSACAGNPLADAARTLLTMELRTYPADADEKTRDWLDQTRALCRDMYLRGYGASDDDMKPWKPIVAASRLFCCPEEEWVQNLALIEEYLG